MSVTVTQKLIMHFTVTQKSLFVLYRNSKIIIRALPQLKNYYSCFTATHGKARLFCTIAYVGFLHTLP
jgi:hypothetical protein